MKLATRFAVLTALVGALVAGGAAAPAAAAGGTISGRVTASTGAALSGVSVLLRDDQGAYGAQTVTGSTGTYSFTDVAPGSYQVIALPANTSVWGAQWYPHAFQSDDAQALTVTGTVAHTGIDFVLERQATIKVTFGDTASPDGKVIVPTAISVYRLNGSAYQRFFPIGGNTANNSVTTIGNLPAGTYRVCIAQTAVPATVYTHQCWTTSPTLQYATSVPLTAGQTTNLTFAMKRLGSNTFADVAADHAFVREIEWLSATGITNGYIDDGVRTFHPLEAVTRQAMAAFLYRLAGSPTMATPSQAVFTDVPANHAFAKEIAWLKAQGITNGNADGSFGTTDPVTRQAMAAFLYRFAGSPAFTPPSTASFTDLPIGVPFFKEVEWLKAQGITNGNADGTFGTIEPVTRQAMAAFLFRTARLP